MHWCSLHFLFLLTLPLCHHLKMIKNQSVKSALQITSMFSSYSLSLVKITTCSQRNPYFTAISQNAYCHGALIRRHTLFRIWALHTIYFLWTIHVNFALKPCSVTFGIFSQNLYLITGNVCSLHPFWSTKNIKWMSALCKYKTYSSTAISHSLSAQKLNLVLYSQLKQVPLHN